jgi:capsular polysaccharide transport system permease protein
MTYAFYRKRTFWIVFGIPNILSILYFLLIATPRYVSEASLVVFQADQGSGAQSINLQLSQNGGGVSLEGDYLLQNYVASWGCFSQLNAKALSDAWSDGDFVSRFGGLLGGFRTTPTALWHYYARHVSIDIDEQSAIAKMRVTGYSPAFVKSVADSVLASSNRALNQVNQQSFVNSERFFGDQIARDRSKLRADIDKLSAFQKSSHVVDPSAAYGAQLELLNQLTARLATLASQIDAVQASTPASDQLHNLASERQSLEQRISGLQNQVYGHSGALSQVTGNYSFLQSMIRNDEAALSADEAQLLHSHQSALQNQYFVEFVGAPTTPVDPTEPNRAMWVLGILLGTALLYLIVK